MSCTQCCGAHQVSAAGTTMYTGTNLSIRTSCEACAIKGKGRGALFLSAINTPLHSWVHRQTPAGDSILFREWAESCGDSGVASGSPGGACFRGRGGAWPAELPCAWFTSVPRHAAGARAWAGLSAAPGGAGSRAAWANVAAAARSGHRRAGAQQPHRQEGAADRGPHGRRLLVRAPAGRGVRVCRVESALKPAGVVPRSQRSPKHRVCARVLCVCVCDDCYRGLRALFCRYLT